MATAIALCAWQFRSSAAAAALCNHAHCQLVCINNCCGSGTTLPQQVSAVKHTLNANGTTAEVTVWHFSSSGWHALADAVHGCTTAATAAEALNCQTQQFSTTIPTFARRVCELNMGSNQLIEVGRESGDQAHVPLRLVYRKFA